MTLPAAARRTVPVQLATSAEPPMEDLGEDVPNEAPWAGAVTFLLYLLLYPRPAYVAGSYGDDAVYVALGRALSLGADYREIFTVGAPLHVKYPPGLPFLLAVLWLVFGNVGRVLAAARVLNALAVATSAAILWTVGRKRLGLSRTTTVVFGLSPLFLDSFLQYSSLPLSEPYMLLGWATATWLALGFADDTEDREKTSRAILLGLTIGVTILFRTQAAVLLPAALLVLLWRRGRAWQALWCFAMGALPAVLWWSASAKVGATRTDVAMTSPTYLQDLMVNGADSVVGSAVARAVFNARGYLGWFVPFFSGRDWLGRAVVGSLLAASVFGGVRVLKRFPELVVYPAASIGLLLLWPYVSDRFLLPTLPFLGLLAAYRIELELRRLSDDRRWTGSVLLVIAAVVVALRQGEVRRAGRAAGPPDTWAYNAPAYLLPWTDRFIREASDEVLRLTSPADRILVDRPPSIWLYTGRVTVPPDPGERIGLPPGRYLAEQILAGNPTVVVVGSPGFRSAQDAAAVIERCPRVLRRLPTPVGAPAVYRVHPDVQCLGPLVSGPGA